MIHCSFILIILGWFLKALIEGYWDDRIEGYWLDIYSRYNFLKISFEYISKLRIFKNHFFTLRTFILSFVTQFINDQCSPLYRNQSVDWFLYDGEHMILLNMILLFSKNFHYIDIALETLIFVSRFTLNFLSVLQAILNCFSKISRHAQWV